jgi:hypothetical protein
MFVVGSRTITYYPTTQYNTKKILNLNSIAYALPTPSPFCFSCLYSKKKTRKRRRKKQSYQTLNKQWNHQTWKRGTVLPFVALSLFLPLFFSFSNEKVFNIHTHKKMSFSSHTAVPRSDSFLAPFLSGGSKVSV